MKKVVHLTSAHPRYDQRILWRECCSLQEHGYDVILVVNDAQKDEILENGVKILSTGFVPKGRRQRMVEGVVRVYELGIAQNADIYHLHDPELLRIALRLKRQGKKVIFDSHEFYSEQIKIKEYIPRIARRIVARSYQTYETYICKRIDGVIVPALYNGRETFEGRAKRIAHVNNYPRQAEYEGVPIPNYSEREKLCYSGSLSVNRGITNLVKAAKRAQAEVILIGKFSPEDYEKEILQCANQKDVQYLGFIETRRKLFEVYAHCAVGVALVLNDGQFEKLEGLLTKVYEYMAVSMPVLISDFPYNRKLIEKYQFGLVANPNDLDDISSKIAWLLEHPKEAEEMGKTGKRLLMGQFTWERGAEPEILRLYQEIEES